MRITEIELKNWGPHRRLKQNTDSPVVGILGPNAAGKTNLLQAIEFALTGNLDKAQETYVRRGEEDGKPITNGSVSVSFVKDGVAGKIFRQVGSSPRRKLEWEGKSYTKIKDLDEILKSVLACDRRAISMAVFLSQGRIGDFLFATPAERERLMASLCLVDHLPRVGEVVDQQMLDVRKLLTDHQTVLDEIEDQIRGAVSRVEGASSRFNECPDHSATLLWLTRRARLVEDLENARVSVQSRNAQLTEAVSKRDMVRPPEGLTAEDLEPLEKKAAGMREARERRDAAAASLRRFENASERFQSAVGKLGSCGEALTSIQELDRQLDLLSRYSAAVDAKKANERELENRREALAKAKSRLESRFEEAARLGEQLPAKESVAKEAVDAMGGEQAVSTARVRLDVLRSVVDKVGDDVRCPVCREGTIRGSASLREEITRIEEGLSKVDSTRREFDRAKADLERVRSVMASDEKLVAEHEADVTRWGGEAAAAEVRLKELEGVISESHGSTFLATSDFTLMTRERGRLAALLGQRRDFERDRDRAKDDMAEEAPEGVEALRDSIKKHAEAAGSDEEFRKIGADLASLKAYVANVDGLAKDVDQATSRLGDAQNTAQAAAVAIEEHDRHRPAAVAGYEDMTAALRDFREKADERNRLKGEYDMAEKSLRSLEERRDGIRRNMEGQARIRELVGDLERLKGAFSRNGIQRLYLTDLFSVLSSLTRANLGDWETDFMVRSDPENTFNFLFCRGDEPEIWMDQKDLSGGQRIRLSISFLLAVQQLIFPELNFMVLDEPSTHLDEEGVAGLVRLFGTLSKTLEEREAQVFVVDHHEGLHRAFSRVIRLSDRTLSNAYTAVKDKEPQ